MFFPSIPEDRSQHIDIIGGKAVQQQRQREQGKKAKTHHLHFVFIYVLLSLVQEPHILLPNLQLPRADQIQLVNAIVHLLQIVFARPFVSERFLANHLEIALLINYLLNSG